MSRYKVSLYEVCFFVILSCIYFIPDKFIFWGTEFRSWILIGITLFLYFYNISVISLTEISFFVFVVFICIFQKSIIHLHLLNLINMYKAIKYKNQIKKFILRGYKIYLLLFGVLIYSLIYAGRDGRYIQTATLDVNQSGYALLLLFLIIRKKNKLIGNILLATGMLTFSKSYLLGIIIFFGANKLSKKDIKMKKIYKWIDFKRLMIISFILLLLLSKLFIIAERNGGISDYRSGFLRYLTFLDYSNYFRFTANENLLHIFYNKPKFLLTGMSTEEFFKENYEVCLNMGMPYRQIKPHNYFFSYMRIYGVFSLVIFSINNKLIKSYLNKKNIGIFLIMFSYLTFLGIGLSNIWLYLSILTLIIYSGDDNDDGVFNNNKNI